jgi:hypothetical protein
MRTRTGTWAREEIIPWGVFFLCALCFLGLWAYVGSFALALVLSIVPGIPFAFVATLVACALVFRNQRSGDR